MVMPSCLSAVSMCWVSSLRSRLLMCVSTLAILSKESGSNRLAVHMFLAYGAVAYLGAVLTYQLVSLIT